MAEAKTTTTTRWWRGAAIYQVYVRSFADGNGDGVGDLQGLLRKLPYIAELGIDAIWLNPWYPSPMADGGYDVADYRAVEPLFGSLVEAEKLVDEAHALGIKIIIDIVPNHCSDQHPWFRQAIAEGPGGPSRELFWFRQGKGEDGSQPPNDWQSRFGGPAWTRTTNPDGTAGDWYLHLYSPEQPDFNWTNREVHDEFDDILRFWLDRGVDGFRIDVADGLVKEDGLPDVKDKTTESTLVSDQGPLPFSDQDGVHEIYRHWRHIADEYPGERVFVGEMWLPDPVRFARYLREDELHSAFNFDFLGCPWEASALRGVIDDTLAAHAPVGAPPTWVLSNHDVTRHVTRYGRADTSFDFGDRQHLAPTDFALGTRRARAAALLTTSLPGGVYVYQGEELGLWEVEDLPDELREDPVWVRSGHTDRGRDGCRVPIPWGGSEPPFKFGDGTAWLPQPAEWSDFTAEVEAADPDSMLSLYRAALRLRRTEEALGDGDLTWLDLGPGVLAFTRTPGFACVVNLSSAPIALPDHDGVLLTSNPLVTGDLPPDTAAWLRLG